MIPIQHGDTVRLLEGSFQFTANIAHAFGRDHATLDMGLQNYVRDRLRDRAAHDRNILRMYL